LGQEKTIARLENFVNYCGALETS